MGERDEVGGPCRPPLGVVGDPPHEFCNGEPPCKITANRNRHGEDEQESKQSDMTNQGTEGKSETPEVEKQTDRNTHPSTTISWDGKPGP